jgi:hypothetical protein
MRRLFELTLPLAAILLIAFSSWVIAGEMSSTNYRITTTVISGGGAPMGSANFQLNSTLGQPSPLMEQGMDPYSDNYGLLPGFWYTVGAGSGCLYDYLGDGDVDGADLAEFMNAISSIEMESFAMEFGRVDCLP